MKRAYLFITFTSSFATMSYAMILASIISDFTGEEILSQCLTMGPYLLGLGFGSIFGDRVKEEKAVKFIWDVEWLSVFSLPLIPLIHMILLFFFLHLSPMRINLEAKETTIFVLGLASIFALFTGIMGGAQLPLIIKLLKTKFKSEIILAINYMGPLFAGPFVVLSNSSSIMASVQVGVVALIQLFGLALLLFISPRRIRSMLMMTIPILIIIGVNKFYPKIEHLTVKASYLGTNMGEFSIERTKSLINILDQYGHLERIRTSYQTVDLFTVPAAPEIQSPQNSTLYLNRKVQFNLFTADLYHQSMIYGGMNLFDKTPENILILGAGDGILLKELKSFPGIKKVDMVELDSGVIEFVKNHPVLSKLNEGIFSDLDPRFNLVIGDAITYLRRAPEETKYDMVYIDFPFPDGHELSKLYSTEFYSLVKRVTSPETIVVIDLPIQRGEGGMLTKETRVILKTLKEVGFVNQLPFGPMATFIAVKREGPPLEFRYDRFPSHLSLAARINLVRTTDVEELSETDDITPVNSMFWPRGM